jgi:hypothetical protein
MTTYITLLINFVKMCGDGGARAYDVNCISYNFHQLLSVYFYRTCCTEKYRSADNSLARPTSRCIFLW